MPKYRLQWILDHKWKNMTGTICPDLESAKKLKRFFQRQYPGKTFKITEKK